LSTATAGNVRDVDFLPLTVDVEERMYAAGKIPGSFFKREGRAGEKATLLAALTLSVDQVHPYDILAMNGASAALMVSDIPFPTAVGAVRIGKLPDGDFVVNPTEEQLQTAEMDLVVAGTDDAILMVEAGANEISEAEILDALDIAHGEIKKICKLQHELREKVGKEKTPIEAPKVDERLLADVKASHGAALDEGTQVEDKLEREDACKAVEGAILEQYGAAAPEGAGEDE